MCKRPQVKALNMRRDVDNIIGEAHAAVAAGTAAGRKTAKHEVDKFVLDLEGAKQEVDRFVSELSAAQISRNMASFFKSGIRVIKSPLTP